VAPNVEWLPNTNDEGSTRAVAPPPESRIPGRYRPTPPASEAVGFDAGGIALSQSLAGSKVKVSREVQRRHRPVGTTDWLQAPDCP
jgi:hypothetical protein